MKKRYKLQLLTRLNSDHYIRITDYNNSSIIVSPLYLNDLIRELCKARQDLKQLPLPYNNKQVSPE